MLRRTRHEVQACLQAKRGFGIVYSSAPGRRDPVSVLEELHELAPPSVTSCTTVPEASERRTPLAMDVVNIPLTALNGRA
ncbi:unnamed protein product [Calypogeia fissa]